MLRSLLVCLHTRCPCSHQAVRGPQAASVSGFWAACLPRGAALRTKALPAFALAAQRARKLNTATLLRAGPWTSWRWHGTSPTARSATSCTRWWPLTQCFIPYGAQISPGGALKCMARAECQTGGSCFIAVLSNSGPPFPRVFTSGHRLCHQQSEPAMYWPSALGAALPLTPIDSHPQLSASARCARLLSQAEATCVSLV